MIYSNALPQGRIEGEAAILAFRALGLDGHSTHTVEVLALSPYALYALDQLIQELKADLSERTSAKVENLPVKVNMRG